MNVLSGFALVVFTWISSAPVAQACSVCGFGQDPAKGAYLSTTAILTFVPLTMLGGIAWWVRRKYLLARDVADTATPTSTVT